MPGYAPPGYWESNSGRGIKLRILRSRNSHCLGLLGPAPGALGTDCRFAFGYITPRVVVSISLSEITSFLVPSSAEFPSKLWHKRTNLPRGLLHRQAPGSSDLHHEHHFLAPTRIPQLGDTNPASHRRRFSGFHHWPLGLPGADPQYGQAGDIAEGAGPPAGLEEDTALDSTPLAGLAWETAGIQAHTWILCTSGVRLISSPPLYLTFGVNIIK
ncbi:uncharacterized protein LOC109117743 isoform X2 [Fukomys damarensis]|uniref:uncharacterized protein LOC109117743 isoform X2 n=1 Tax=Fukomys damarensis TaxID=885580 RepID=UPI0008FF4018|nr:uncharacterized protein LOC109117743 isoform X2 [Fukomys damarensis]